MAAQDLWDKQTPLKLVRSKIQVRQKLNFRADVAPYVLSFGIIMFCSKCTAVVKAGQKRKVKPEHYSWIKAMSGHPHSDQMKRSHFILTG